MDPLPWPWQLKLAPTMGGTAMDLTAWVTTVHTTVQMYRLKQNTVQYYTQSNFKKEADLKGNFFRIRNKTFENGDHGE